MDPEDVQLYYQIVVTGRRDLGLAPSDRSGCEMTILRMFAFQPATVSGSSPEQHSDAAATAERSAATAYSASETEPTGAVCEAPAATRPSPTSAAGSSASGAPEALSRESWPRVLRALNLNGSVKAVAGMLAVGEIDDKRVEFRLGRDDLILVSDRFKASLAKALQDYSGLERKLDFKPISDDADLLTPARMDNDERVRAQADAETAVAEDPVVKRMQEKFDAEIVPGSVRPANSRSDQ